MRQEELQKSNSEELGKWNDNGLSIEKHYLKVKIQFCKNWKND